MPNPVDWEKKGFQLEAAGCRAVPLRSGVGSMSQQDVEVGNTHLLLYLSQLAGSCFKSFIRQKLAVPFLKAGLEAFMGCSVLFAYTESRTLRSTARQATVQSPRHGSNWEARVPPEARESMAAHNHQVWVSATVLLKLCCKPANLKVRKTCPLQL